MVGGGRRVSATRIALVYLGAGAIWFAAFDRVVPVLLVEPAAAERLQSLGGPLFLLLSAPLLALLVYRSVRSARAREARFGALVEESHVGFYVVRGGRFLYANPALAAIFGYAPGEMISHVAVEDCVVAQDGTVVTTNLDRLERGEVPSLRFRFSGVRGDGEPVRLEVFGQKTAWEDGPAVMGVVLDVTELERLQEQGMRSLRLEAMGRLTGTIAHDFNNLLTAIMGGLTLGLSNLRSDHPARPELEQVQRTAARAADITRQLLTFSRRRSARAVLIDASDEAERVRPILNRLCGEGVTLEADLQRPLPPISLDATHFEQVILNLVVNARDAIEEEGRIVIRTYVVDPDDPRLRQRERPAAQPYVVLEVSDDGCGIDEESRLEVFEPFYTTKEGGTGLGLSTVYGIVTGAGGFIRVESHVGLGSTFRVHFPAAAGRPEAPREEAEKAVVPARRRPEASILLVDDEEVVRNVTAAVLRRLGYVILEVGGGREAMRLARERAGEIDLLLTDLVLRDASGFDVAAAFLRHNPGRPVVYTSGYGDEEMIAVAERDGGAFLEKPYDVHRLARAVQDALRAPEGVRPEGESAEKRS